VGTTILGSDWNCNSELIENYKNRILIKINDADHFIEKLKLMRDNLVLLWKIVDNNREKQKIFFPKIA
jgi:hypothetical protein